MCNWLKTTISHKQETHKEHTRNRKPVPLKYIYIYLTRVFCIMNRGNSTKNSFRCK